MSFQTSCTVSSLMWTQFKTSLNFPEFSLLNTAEKYSFTTVPISYASTHRKPCWSLRGPIVFLVTVLPIIYLKILFTVSTKLFLCPLFVFLGVVLHPLSFYSWSQLLRHNATVFLDQSFNISCLPGFHSPISLSLHFNGSMLAVNSRCLMFKSLPLIRRPFTSNIFPQSTSESSCSVPLKLALTNLRH